MIGHGAILRSRYILPPMSCSFRYMLRQLFWPLVFAVLVIAGVIWISQSLRFVDLVLNRNLPPSLLVQLPLFVLPKFATVFLPLILFAVTLFVYTKMAVDSELVALRACGLSPARLARPAVVMALLVVGIGYLLNLYAMPTAYREFKEIQAMIREDHSHILIREGEFSQFDSGLTVYVRDRSPQGELLGILIHDRRSEGAPVTIMAEKGAMIRAEGVPRVVLINGNRQTLRADNDLSILYFDRYTLDLATQEAGGGPRWPQPDERYLHELLWIDTTGVHAASNLRFRQILLAEGHHRLASPWLNLAFVMIALAALLTGEFNRRGKNTRIVVATVIVLALQAAMTAAHSLAGTIPAMIPLMYLLPLSAIVAGFWYLMREPKRRPGGAAALAARV